MFQAFAYKPQIKDLIRIFDFAVLNKRTTILEFGSGWSTLVFSLAMNILEKKYGAEVLNLRRATPFKIFSVENEKEVFKNNKKKTFIFL